MIWTVNLVASVFLAIVALVHRQLEPFVFFLCIAGVSAWFVSQKLAAQFFPSDVCQCDDCRRARGEPPRTPVANIIPQAPRYQPAPQIEYSPPVTREVVVYRPPEPVTPPPTPMTEEMRQRAFDRWKRENPDEYYGNLTRQAEGRAKAARAELAAVRAERELEKEQDRISPKGPTANSLYDLRDELNADGEDTSDIDRVLRRFT